MATAFIDNRNGERGKNSIPQLRSNMRELAEKNGERIDYWIGGDGNTELDVLGSIRNLEYGSSLYIEEVSSLGGSMDDVLMALLEAVNRNIHVHGVKDGFSFDDAIDQHSYAAALKHIKEIYNSIISSRTREALEKKRQEGVKLGRPVGTCSKLNLLRRNRDFIAKAIKNGIHYNDLCRKYQVSISTFRRFLETEGLLLAGKTQY